MPSARAAVLRQTATPMTIETVEVGPVAPGDVLVRVRAASLCHTDLEAIEGALAVKLPAVLGHEAAGEVVELGAGVTRAFASAIAWCCRGTRIVATASIAIVRSQSCVRNSSPMGRRRSTSMAVRGCRAMAWRCTSSCISAGSLNTAWCRRKVRSACQRQCRSIAPRCWDAV